MSFELKSTISSKANIRTLAKNQIRKAIKDANARKLAAKDCDRHEIVHVIRTRCKKVRALLRLVRPAMGDAYQVENQTIRDAADLVGSIRDTKVVLETFDEAMKHSPRSNRSDFTSAVRQNLLGSLDAISPETIDQQLSQFRELMSEAEERVDAWQLRKGGFNVIGDGLLQVHQKAVDRLSDALKDRSDESLHEFRKEAKYHRHHMRLLKPLWPPLLDPYIGQLSELGELLGDEHNFAVLRQRIADMDIEGRNRNKKRFLAMLNEQSCRLKSQAYLLGQRLFSEPSDAFVDRIHAYWKIWRQ